MLLDSLKQINFHEVFYLDNYFLSCQVVSVAPSMEFFTTTGIDVGREPIFYCCVNNKEKDDYTATNDLVHVKRMERVLNFDSIKNSRTLKQTFALNATQLMWYGAAKGAIKIMDVKKNQLIPAKNVMNYNFLDSEKVDVFDSSGAVVDVIMRERDPTFPYLLTNDVQFTQDIYYDTSRNVFTSTISDCFLIVKYLDLKSYKRIVEKRFSVSRAD